MNNKKCNGCGYILQCTQPDMNGYVPSDKYLLEDNIICKRCFRLKHYGNVPDEINDIEEYRKEVKNAINKSDIVLSIYDVIDFEASFTTEIIDLLENKKSITILNKIDLLPSFLTKTQIVNWFKQRIYDENVFPEYFCFVSAKKNDGLKSIIKKIYQLFPNNKEIKVAILGASNVGKSSILNILTNTNKMTISKYSGTTKKNIQTSIKYKDKKIQFIDTPGLIPDGRLSDLLPPKKAVKLVPTKEISRKTFTLNENQVLMFSNLIYLKAKNKMTIQAYASKDVEFHITSELRSKELMNSNYFKLLNEEETLDYQKNEFITENIKLEKYDDLYISGLGFIIQKKGYFDIEITYPKGVRIMGRPSISKNNQISDEEDFGW